MRILIVGCEKPQARLLKGALQADFFAVDVEPDLAEGMLMAKESEYDLVILECGAQKSRAVREFRRVESRKKLTTLLLAIVRNSVEDRIESLSNGADDCLSRPFALSELSAHVHALLRRRGFPSERMLKVVDLELDMATRTATRAGRRIELTSREFSLLLWLMQNADRVLTRQTALDRVWNVSFDKCSNVVDVYINYLRRKVDQGFERKLIRTVRGAGYKMAVAD
jgi:DNA-binding response OmpR family regulator